MKESGKKANVRACSAGPVYFFGFIGSLVYYIQVAHGFWRIVLGFLKAVVWPAFLTHDLLKFLS